MMKHNKGFTLIELLATIMIIGIVAAIAVVSVTGVFSNAQNNISKITIDNINKAAELYFQDNYDDLKKGSSFTIKDLVDKQYLKSDPTDDDGNILSGNFNVDENTDGILSYEKLDSTSLISKRTLAVEIKKSSNIAKAKGFDNLDNYYFPGNSTNNYISFAGYTWRILRLNGDNSIRIVLPYSSTNPNKDALTLSASSWGGTVLETRLNSYYNSLSTKYKNMITQNNFCFEKVNYSGYSIPSSEYNDFECKNGLKKANIGTLSLSELYMYNKGNKQKSDSFLGDNSAFISSTLVKNTSNGATYSNIVNTDDSTKAYQSSNGRIYYVVNLKKDTVINSNGNGSQTKPYIIEGEVT